METKEYYGGTYPEAPEYETKTVKVICSFVSYVEIPADLDEDEIQNYLQEYSDEELSKEADRFIVEDYELI